MNIFVYLWKRVLFRRYFWQPEELEQIKKKAKEMHKYFGWE